MYPILKMSNAGIDMTESETQVLTVIPDANVLIHGKTLTELPWGELNRSNIEVVFVPPVIRELDKLKNQSGRPNKIARQLTDIVAGGFDVGICFADTLEMDMIATACPPSRVTDRRSLARHLKRVSIQLAT